MAVRAVGAQCADPRTGPGHDDPLTEGALAERARRRRHGLSEEERREIRRILDENLNRGTAAVYEQFAAPQFYSYRTTARWVAEVREREELEKQEREDQ